ncbi:putative nucleotidyltransferase, ribonuclease H [Tanacetum coccineum]
MSRTMLNEQSLPQKFWCNAVDTLTYILNRIQISAILRKTPYEILRGRKPTIDYFRVFGSKCFFLNTKDYLTKFDPKSYEGVLLGYSQNSKAYIILNKHTRKIEESLNVTFDETPPPSKTSPLVNDDLNEEEAIREIKKKKLENIVEDEKLEIDEIVNIKESRNHPLENVIGNLNQRTLRSQAENQSNFYYFISTIEPKNINEALGDESWIVAMHEELNQFIVNDVWELVPQPKNMTIIGTKWVFGNKLDENGIVFQNKARLVAQGYNQQEGIDYDKTYASVARLESIRILLAYACALDFKLFQMDVKSAFLNGFINEECLPLSAFKRHPTLILEAVNAYLVDTLKVTTHLGLWYPKRDRWRLNELAYGIPSDGPYQTNLPSIEDIISSIRINRDCQVRRICHEEEIDVLEYQVLTCEIEPTLKPLEEIIRENVFCLGGNRDPVPACLCYMLYYVFITRLFKFTIRENPELENESYVLYDRVMTPLAARLERKPRRDCGTRRGRHSTSSSSTFDQPSSSHLNDDDDDGNDEGTSRVSTPSSIRYVNSLTNQVPQVFQNPPNMDAHLEPIYTCQTEIINRQVKLRDEQRGELTILSSTQLTLLHIATQLLESVFLTHMLFHDLKQHFWWSGMKRDVATFVSKCLTCQQVKIEHQRASGLLQPLEIPVWKWDEISMDFVTGLPRTQRKHDAIWVVVDRLTKSAHFLPIRKDYPVSKIAEMFQQEIVRLHGTPSAIVSDRDPRFTSRFWKGLQKAWGTRLKFSTAFHPETDGQSERTIQTLEDMLRSCALEWAGNWDDYICLVEFAYNNSWHASIKCAPFEMLYGRKCRAPICWDQVGERILEGPEMIEVTNEKVAVAREKLKEAQTRQKSYADRHRRALEFQPGEHVFLKVSPTRGVRRFGIKGKLSPRFIGPFEILDRVGEVSYRLALPPQLSHVHNVFHVSLLRGYKYHPLHVISYPFDQIREDLSYTEEPESILDRQDRVMRNKTIPFVKILWRNHPEREATWETEESIRTSYPHFLP